MVLSIALMFAYATQGRRRKIADSRIVSPLLCGLGLLVGLSFENVPPAIAVFIAGRCPRTGTPGGASVLGSRWS